MQTAGLGLGFGLKLDQRRQWWEQHTLAWADLGLLGSYTDPASLASAACAAGPADRAWQ